MTDKGAAHRAALFAPGANVRNEDGRAASRRSDGEDETRITVEYAYYAGTPERGPSYSSGGQPAEGPKVEIMNVWITENERLISWQVRP
jgi:hypothetical protein